MGVGVCVCVRFHVFVFLSCICQILLSEILFPLNQIETLLFLFLSDMNVLIDIFAFAIFFFNLLYRFVLFLILGGDVSYHVATICHTYYLCHSVSFPCIKVSINQIKYYDFYYIISNQKYCTFEHGYTYGEL